MLLLLQIPCQHASQLLPGWPQRRGRCRCLPAGCLYPGSLTRVRRFC